METTMTSKGQIVIPSGLRRKFGLREPRLGHGPAQHCFCDRHFRSWHGLFSAVRWLHHRPVAPPSLGPVDTHLIERVQGV